MTKTELLNRMKRWRACYEATAYVTSHHSDDAAEILGQCNRVDWLLWLLARECRLARFVRVCAKRASSKSTSWGNIAKRQAARYVTGASDGTSYERGRGAVEAAYAALSAAPNSLVESEKQLVGLHRIAREWANGSEAEV